MLRPLGLATAVMGNAHGGAPQKIPPDVVRHWIDTGDKGNYHESILARNIEPGAIGVGLVDPEILINVPCRMVIIADLVLDDGEPEPEIGEYFYYRMKDV